MPLIYSHIYCIIACTRITVDGSNAFIYSENVYIYKTKYYVSNFISTLNEILQHFDKHPCTKINESIFMNKVTIYLQ